MAKITINGISIDPATNGAALSRARLFSTDSASSDYILVQTSAPIDQEQQAGLEKLGATIVEYVPENTYICHYPPAALDEIRSLPFVSWANPYLRDFKIAASLRSEVPVGGVASLLSLPSTRALLGSTDRVTVDVVLHRHAEPEGVRARLAAAAGLDPAELKPGRHKIRLTVERRRLPDLAAIDQVRSIEPYVPPQLANSVACEILKADVVHAATSLQGEGQVIAVCDTGFDTGSTADVHPAFTGRVLKLYALGRSTASDPNGHGTHVAGSALGDGQSQILNTAIRGTAPRAGLVLQSILAADGSLGGLPDDLHDLFEPPYARDGARIHTNSWGSAVQGGYTAHCLEVDDFVWTHRDLVVCFAAGNDGADRQRRGVVDPGSLEAPGSARNCITVGATESLRPGFPDANAPLLYGEWWGWKFPVDPIHGDQVADNPDGTAAFSSRGPAAGNRIKPDVVAPGTAILSARSRIATGRVWADSADPLYVFDGGTSMATPLVAGCAAVIRQFLQARGVTQPGAALVKAMLINGAGLIPDQFVAPELEPAPNGSQGFGRVDLAATVGPYRPDETVDFVDEDRALNTGERTVTMHPVAAAGRTLKATLVWTDLPGEVLQNDLDLIVRAGGREWHGNMPSSSQAFDRANNVEQVIWPDIPAGEVEVVVQAYRTVQPQPYALVVRIS